MSNLSFIELRRGLCAYLDVNMIRSRHNSYCNTKTADLAVNRNGLFILLKPVGNDRWLTAPLFSRGVSYDRIKLYTPFKSGPGRRWREGETFISSKQFWIMDARTIIDSAHLDNNSHGDRQRFGDRVPDAISELIGYASDNKDQFKRIKS